MKRFSQNIPFFVLLLVSVLGVSYASYVRTSFPRNGYSPSEGAVLGETVASIHIDLLIKFNGRELRYATDAPKPSSSLADLLNEFGQQGDLLLGYKRSGDGNKIYKVDTFLSAESEGIGWHVYINDDEYVGLFSEKVLLDGDVVKVVYE